MLCFPPSFFHPCSRSLMISPLFSVLQNAVLSLITRATVLLGFISDVRTAPFRCSSHMHTVYPLDSQFTLCCLVLLPCFFSRTQWARKSDLADIHSAMGYNEYKCSWQAAVIVFLTANCSLAAIGQDYNITKKVIEQ